MSNATTTAKHPPGLYLLFLTEMWERFSYYGMRGLLMLFLTKSVMEGGLGFDAGNAGMLYGVYTGLVYLTPIFGGILADKILGQRNAITIGGITMAIGQFCLAGSTAETNWMVYLGLILLIIGNGFFKPNISTIVGQLYEEGDSRRDGAFTIFYMGINLGAFLAPLVCGYLAEDMFAVKDAAGTITSYGFRYGFLAAGIGMVLGQVGFNLLAQKYLGNIGARPNKSADAANAVAAAQPLTPQERDRLTVIIIMMVFNIFFWAGFEQAGSTLSLYTDTFINRQVGSFLVPTSWFQSVNPLFIVALGPLFTGFWAYLNSKDKEPNTIIKMALGMILLGIGFFFMIGAVMERGDAGDNPSVKANIMWLVMTYLVHTIGELCLSPVGMSMVTKLAPIRLGSLMMGVWLLSSFIANFLSGFAVTYVESMGHMAIFSTIAAVVIVLGLIVFAISGKLLDWMHGVR